jgi:hypothetical protein
MPDKPRIFVASSKERIAVSDALQSLLSETGVVVPWNQGVFELGQSAVASLVKFLDEADFSVIVMAADDIAISRRAKHAVSRDNVVFEFGLAIGKLGPERCYYLLDSAKSVKLPSDLLGITGAVYDSTDSRSLMDSLRAPAVRIRDSIVALGRRPKLDAKSIAAIEQHNSFCNQIVGNWWQTVRPDDASALSFVRMEIHAATRTVKMSGDAYDTNGQVIARWETEAVCVNSEARKLFYLWRGVHPERPDAPYEGFGEISFRMSERGIETAFGHFSDANTLDLKSLRKKTTELRRSTDREAEEMKPITGKGVATLVRRKLAEMSGRQP